MRDGHLDDPAALDEWWDGVVRGRESRSAAPALAPLVRRLHGEDAAPRLPAVVADEVWARVLAMHRPAPVAPVVRRRGAAGVRPEEFAVSGRRPWLTYAGIAAVMVGLIGFSVWWSRGESTPTSEEGGFGGLTHATPTVEAVVCQMPPRSIESIERLAAEGAAAPSPTPLPEPTGLSTPVIAIPDETIAAIDRTVREMIACIQDGEPLRAWALVTDDYIRRSGHNHVFRFDGTPVPPDYVTTVVLVRTPVDPAAPFATETAYFRLTWVLEDGRLQGFVAFHGDPSHGPAALRPFLLDAFSITQGLFFRGDDINEDGSIFATFRLIGDRWLLDAYPVFDIDPYAIEVSTRSPPFTETRLPVSGMPPTPAP